MKFDAIPVFFGLVVGVFAAFYFGWTIGEDTAMMQLLTEPAAFGRKVLAKHPLECMQMQERVDRRLARKSFEIE